MFKAPYTTHPVRLHIYSHDITSPPWIFKKLIKEADVVVQPRSEDDLVEILEYAKENKMPIVPRVLQLPVTEELCRIKEE